jgi:hypothetical protein
MKKTLCVIAMAALAAATLLAADYDRFLKASDGEVIGVLELGKQKLQLTGTIKEVTWTATNGKAVKMQWDGHKLKTEELP